MQTIKDTLEAAEVTNPQPGQPLTAVHEQQSAFILNIPSHLYWTTRDFVASQAPQALAVGQPVGSAGSGNAPVVVQIYSLGCGVSIERKAPNLSCAQGTFELESHGHTLVFAPGNAIKAERLVLPIERYIEAVGLQLETVDQEDIPDACRFFGHTWPQSQTAILSLPAATGKTTVAHQLAIALNCKYIVDEWHPGLPMLQNALHLTNVAQGGAA